MSPTGWATGTLSHIRGRHAPIFENFLIRHIFLIFLNIKMKKRRSARVGRPGGQTWPECWNGLCGPAGVCFGLKTSLYIVLFSIFWITCMGYTAHINSFTKNNRYWTEYPWTKVGPCLTGELRGGWAATGFAGCSLPNAAMAVGERRCENLIQNIFSNLNFLNMFF